MQGRIRAVLAEPVTKGRSIPRSFTRRWSGRPPIFLHASGATKLQWKTMSHWPMP